MQLRHVIASLVAFMTAIGAIGAITGCGGASREPSAAKPSEPAAGGQVITIAGFKFAPGTEPVSRGARITVTNHDGTAHTASADDGHSFDTGDIDPGATATVTLSKPGTYDFHCSIHPFMHGALVVR